jgi:hypothetical protein
MFRFRFEREGMSERRDWRSQEEKEEASRFRFERERRGSPSVKSQPVEYREGQ